MYITIGPFLHKLDFETLNCLLLGCVLFLSRVSGYSLVGVFSIAYYMSQESEIEDFLWKMRLIA